VLWPQRHKLQRCIIVQACVHSVDEHDAKVASHEFQSRRRRTRFRHDAQADALCCGESVEPLPPALERPQSDEGRIAQIREGKRLSACQPMPGRHGELVAGAGERLNVEIDDGVFHWKRHDPEIVLSGSDLAFEIEASLDVQQARGCRFLRLPERQNRRKHGHGERNRTDQTQGLDINRAHLRRDLGQPFQALEDVLRALEEFASLRRQVQLSVAP